MPENKSAHKQNQETFKRCISTAYRITYTFLKNREDVEQVTARVMSARFSQSRSFRSEKQETAWIITAAETICRDYLREERRQIDTGDLESPIFDTAKYVDNPTLNTILSLPKDLKTVVFLYYHEGLTTMEIAEYMNLRPSTIRGRLADARMDLNMTRQNVRDAYAKITLSEDKQEAMYASILDDISEGRLAQQRSGPALVIGRKGLICIAAAAVVVAAVAVSVLFLRGNSKSYESLPNSPIATSASQPAATVTIPSKYREIITQISTAMRSGWSSDQYYQADLSYLYLMQESAEKIGYALIDLDNNGTDELIITDGNVIYDLFTTEAGETVHLFSGAERNSYRLCEKNYIFQMMSDGAVYTEYNLYCLHGVDLIQEEVVVFDASTEDSSPWFVGFGREHRTEAAAHAVIAEFNPKTIPMTPITSVS